MKKIILQHWKGEMDELCTLSFANISKYAEKVGADYELLRGDVFNPTMTSPCQKLHMLDERFDEYDMVVMLDADMFTRKGMEEDVFNDLTGIGRHQATQTRLANNLKRLFPDLGDLNYPYWGGAIYRLDKETRQKLRKHINMDELMRFNNRFYDEGMMHRLAVLAKIEKSYVPGNRWDCGSYEDGVETSAMIHIRKKVGPKGPKQDKMINYTNLVNRGIIEE